MRGRLNASEAEAQFRQSAFRSHDVRRPALHLQFAGVRVPTCTFMMRRSRQYPVQFDGGGGDQDLRGRRAD